MSTLLAHRYGKNRVLVGLLDRACSPHRYLELAVDVALQGAFADTYTRGDNTLVVPTDTIKNTVYLLARREECLAIEEFALILARHFFATYAQVDRAEIAVEQRGWRPIEIDGEPRADAFERAGEERAVCGVSVDAGGVSRLTSGLVGLELLKTAHSGFRDFFRDTSTTLQDTDDRLFATVVEATWRYGPAAWDPSSPCDWSAVRASLRGAMMRAFAEHASLSVQQTLYVMGEAALASSPVVEEVRLVLPNRHHVLADLSRFGLDNPNLVFVPTSEPFGRIEATVGRAPGDDP
jgi:urate oxidase